MSAAPQLDFAAVARLALAQAESLLAAWFPAGRKRGHEWVVGNLAGDAGESLSININTGQWGDFASDERGGDLISLYAAIHRLGQGDALRGLAAELGAPVVRQPAGSAKVIPMPSRDESVDGDWALVLPVPDDAGPPPNAHSRHGPPVHVARYESGAGALLYYVYRFEPEGQRKQFSGVTYWRHRDGKGEWRFKSPPTPRPLFGLPSLLAQPNAPVLIVEGERKCEAAQKVLGTAYACVTWPNGAQSAGRADWSPLAGRNAVMWPDADAPGQAAANAVCVQVRQAGGTVRVVHPPEGAPEGWDVGDAIAEEGWDAKRITAHLSAPAEPHDNGHSPEPQRDSQVQDYVPMGHDRGRFYFYGRAGGQVRDFSARDLTGIGSLLEIAPLSFWEREYPGKTGADVRAAGNALIAACHRAGIYDPDRLRGRGAWLDEGHAVLHLGDRLLINGHDADLNALNGHAIYERARRLPVDIGAAPLAADKAARLMELCMALPFEDVGSMGRLLAGWCVIAPVCGAMPWRPHLWLVSEAGGGKTWVWDNIVRPLLGAVALRCQSKSTEAFLRQRLGSDALPVLFDEFESQNDRDRDRIQQVLDLARQASSEDGAEIGKGGQDGRAKSYRIRSCFAFASINLGLSQAADESRTVVLTLRPNDNQAARAEAFAKLKVLHAEIMQPGFAAALLARTLKLMPVIRANAETFAQAIARTAGRRTGDTVGVLLAGAWSLRTSRLATAEEAAAFVTDQEWVKNAVDRSAADPEWRRALSFLAQQTIRVVPKSGKVEDVPVGELLAKWDGSNVGSDAITREDAELALTRAGIRLDLDAPEAVFYLATGAEQVRRWFQNSTWATGWAATIARAPGVTKMDKARRFGPLVSKGLAVPLQLLLGVEDE